LAQRAIGELRSHPGPGFPIIGVGGISTPEGALRLREAGADLVQLYTGLVYRGPSLVVKCARAIGAPS
jgi:dihydroorotate dehydrogenase